MKPLFLKPSVMMVKISPIQIYSNSVINLSFCSGISVGQMSDHNKLYYLRFSGNDTTWYFPSTEEGKKMRDDQLECIMAAFGVDYNKI